LSWPPDAQKIQNEKIITVNIGQVMFSGEIYYYWPLNSSEKVDKIVGKTVFFLCIIYCVTNAVAVLYTCSRNILMAEKRIVCFQSNKKGENM